jgi:hypothetical protein
MTKSCTVRFYFAVDGVEFLGDFESILNEMHICDLDVEVHGQSSASSCSSSFLPPSSRKMSLTSFSLAIGQSPRIRTSMPRALMERARLIALPRPASSSFA